MNRLVIVGNGFDLAHGLKTSYEDFIVDLIKKAILEKFQDEKENDIFKITINKNYRSVNNFINNDLYKLNSLNEILDCRFIHFELENLNESINEKIIRIKYPIFIKDLLKNDNWTDIEKYYFDCILDFLNKYKTTHKNKNLFQEDINKLNQEFLTLKNYLSEYILQINKTKNESKIPFFNELFTNF